MVILSDLSLVLLSICWLSCFIYCYQYYGSTDHNRINFKTWSMISFLYALTNICLFIDANFDLPFIKGNESFLKISLYIQYFVAILFAIIIHEKEFVLKNKIKLRIMRYVDLFIQLLIIIFFIMGLFFHDPFFIVIAQVILSELSLLKNHRIIAVIMFLDASATFVSVYTHTFDYFIIIQFIILLISIKRIHYLFVRENNKNKSIKE